MFSQVRTDIKYNEYLWPGTHNSYNSSVYSGIQSMNGYGDNQTITITEQLELGIRVLMLDVYYGANSNIVCGHGLARTIFGNEYLTTYLLEIKEFLAKTPDAIVTIIWENHIRPDDLLNALSPILTPYIYEHKGEWPSIETMISKKQRLVNFIEKSNWSDNSTTQMKNKMPYA